MSTPKKSLLIIVALIVATTAALAAMQAHGPSMGILPGSGQPDPLTVTAEVVQKKVLKNADGRVTVALNLVAAETDLPEPFAAAPTDLVIVLDRSGSMEGAKINDARHAVEQLLTHLTPHDRLALYSYANQATRHVSLAAMTSAHRRDLLGALDEIQAGGGTNLGAGLKLGTDTLIGSDGQGRQRRLILISDGLANQGITDPAALGQLAAAATDHHFSISTVGVGLDFNETLMTAIADRGAGNYHFLEDPRVFAQVFETELGATRQVAAGDIAIHIPLTTGVRLVSAGGYPIDQDGMTATIHPGNLLGGQEKALYLTFQVPTAKEQDIVIGQIETRYRHNGRQITAACPARPLTVACVNDPAAVMASIDGGCWEDQVVQEEFSRLKEEVAADIRQGDRQRAREKIRAYHDQQAAINTVVGSATVTDNLTVDLPALRRQVEKTFEGAPAVVARKQKKAAKSLQYEGYQGRRDKKQKSYAR